MKPTYTPQPIPSIPLKLPSRERIRGAMILAAGALIFACVACMGSFLIFGPHLHFPQTELTFGTEDSIGRPSYLAVDGKGQIYTAGWNDGKVRIFDAQGNPLRVIDLGKGTNILSLAVSPGGDIYLAYDGVIHHLDTEGKDTVISYADAKGDLLGDVAGIALLKDGGLVAADKSGNILKFGPDGKGKILVANAFEMASFTTRNWYGGGSAPLQGESVGANNADLDSSLAVDGSGNVFAVSWTNTFVLRANMDSGKVSKFGQEYPFPTNCWWPGRFDWPQGVVTDSYGRVYVGDSSCIQAFDSNGNYLFSIELWGNDVEALAIDAQNNLYYVTYPIKVFKLAAQGKP